MEKKTLSDYTKEELDNMSVREYNEIKRSLLDEDVENIKVELLSEEEFINKLIKEGVDDTDLAINPPTQEELRNWRYKRYGK